MGFKSKKFTGKMNAGIQNEYPSIWRATNIGDFEAG
jgi:hypothetical protein